MKIIEARKTEITVKRPDGKIETMIHPKIDYMTDGILTQMRKAMRDAGRGEVISYRNIEAVVEMEEADYQTHCERCGQVLDIRTAKNQKEWMRHGGSKVQVIAYYCDGCHALLTTIGKGEWTPMQERAAYVPSYEPTTKND